MIPSVRLISRQTFSYLWLPRTAVISPCSTPSENRRQAFVEWSCKYNCLLAEKKSTLLAKSYKLSRPLCQKSNLTSPVSSSKSLVENIYTIPNALSFTRILVSPYIGYLILSNDYNMAFTVILLAGLTDMADGYIARNWESQRTKFGSFLDPLADKIIISTIFITLSYVDMMPTALTALVVSRDVCLAAGASYVRLESLPSPKTARKFFDFRQATAQLKPTLVSKVNTVFQLGTAVASVSAPVFGFIDHPLLQCTWAITAALTVTSGLSYVVQKTAYYHAK